MTRLDPFLVPLDFPARLPLISLHVELLALCLGDVDCNRRLGICGLATRHPPLCTEARGHGLGHGGDKVVRHHQGVLLVRPGLSASG
jgi:hypothetical protein